MVAKSYSLNFSGYWRAANRDGLPAVSGLFCVYSCSHNAIVGGLTMKELLFIGEAANIRSGVANHPEWNRWQQYLRYGEELCFSAALVPASERDRALAALIFQHRPPCNEDPPEIFPLDTTTVKTTGETFFLSPLFTLSQAPFRTRNRAIYAEERS
jgi:hypothetical protein